MRKETLLCRRIKIILRPTTPWHIAFGKADRYSVVLYDN